MENWILVVGYDRPHFEVARKDWQKYNVYLHSVETAAEAINHFHERQYLAVIALYNVPNMASLIDFISGTIIICGAAIYVALRAVFSNDY